MENIETNEFKKIRRIFIKKVYKIIKNEISNNFVISPDESKLIVKKKSYKLENLDDIKKYSIELEKGLISTTKKQCIKIGQLAKIKNGKQINYTPSFIKIYDGTARTILNNLSPNNYIENAGLINKVLNGGLDPYDFANIAYDRPQTLYPEINQKYYDFIEKQEDISFNKKIDVCSTIRCKQCKQFTCVVTQAQTRSVDEAMTTFITCLNCGYHGRP
jgi:DNA-directed RNA polymerase subunit M/transcription elongation factor TFIIS